MNKTLPRAVLVGLVAWCLAAPSARAASADHVVVSRTLKSNGAFSFRFDVPTEGAAIRLLIDTVYEGFPHTLGYGVWVYDSSGEIVAEFVEAGGFPPKEVKIRSPWTGTLVHSTNDDWGSGGPLRFGIGTDHLDGGQYTAVLVGTAVASGRTTTKATLFDSSGVHLVKAVTSSSTFIVEETTLDGGTTIFANGDGLMLQDSWSHHVGSSFFGAFWVGDTVSLAEYSGPDGGGSLKNFYDFAGSRRGDYTFTIQARVSVADPLSGFALFGGDIVPA